MAAAEEDMHLGVKPPNLYPFCIVWTPIPLVTWLVPFVGHLGIGSSAGTIYDFADFGITRGCFAFGSPARYLPLSPSAAAALQSDAAGPDWDRALERSTLAFDGVSYNFVTTNCHAYVQYVLESIAFGGSRRWGTVKLAALMFVLGRFPSAWAFVKTVVPFVAFFSIGVAFGRLTFIYAWGGLVACVTFILVLGALCKRMPAGATGEVPSLLKAGSDDVTQSVPLRRCFRK